MACKISPVMKNLLSKGGYKYNDSWAESNRRKLPVILKRYYRSSNIPVLFRPEQSQADDSWRKAKEKFLTMDDDEKRSYYKVKGNFFSLDRIRPWPVYYDKMKNKLKESGNKPKYSVNFAINSRVSIGKADLTALELDVIVNSAALDLSGGGGVLDQACHDAAGPELLQECQSFHGCDIGESKLTGGYRLPAKYVIHTVGPKTEIPSKLKLCYKNTLTLMKMHRFGTIAFPCVSTGSSGYPRENAAHIALETVRKFLHKHPDKPHRICFCIHSPEDLEIYEELMQVYFPMK